MPTVLMMPPWSDRADAERAAVAEYASPIVAMKKIVASTAVERERKLADPLAPATSEAPASSSMPVGMTPPKGTDAVPAEKVPSAPPPKK